MPDLELLRARVTAAWDADTCDPVDRADWTPGNPSRGQCGPTALVLHDLLGGQLLLAEVTRDDGTRQGFHWWNRLPDGREVDLTREQFAADEHVGEPSVVERPPGLPRRCAAEYALLSARVASRAAATGPAPAGPAG